MCRPRRGVPQWLWQRLPEISTGSPPDLKYLRRVVAQIVRRLDLRERSEWNHYGSGTASFADIWLYRDAPDFRRPLLDSAEESFTGLWLLINRFVPCYVMGEGEQSWSATNGGRYMPELSGVDRFATPAVERLAADVQRIAGDCGVVRLHRSDVESLLPSQIKFTSNLSNGELRIFDALFFWND